MPPRGCGYPQRGMHMQMTGEFVTSLDLGDIGAHDCTCEWSGYRPAVRAEDDYEEMEISKVTIDLCKQIIDVTGLLTQSAMDTLKDEAWGHFPTREDLAAEAADHWMQERADRRIDG